MKRAIWLITIFSLAVLAIAETRFIKVHAAPNNQILDPSNYLPIVFKQELPTPIPTQSPTPTVAPPPGRPQDGSWSGEAITNGYPEQPQPITFTVEGDGARIASGARITTYVYGTFGAYICYGTVQWTIGNPINIAADGSFHFSAYFSGINQLTWDGDFVTPDRAEGTFHSQVSTSKCLLVIQDGTWSANLQAGN